VQVRRRARFAVGHAAVLNVVVVPLLRALLPDAVIMIADNAAVEDGVSQPHAHITGGAGGAGGAGWVGWAGWRGGGRGAVRSVSKFKTGGVPFISPQSIRVTKLRLNLGTTALAAAAPLAAAVPLHHTQQVIKRH